MAKVILKNVKKVFDNSVVAVEDFSLSIEDREFIVFVGPSGCGKSTTLRMIAGLEELSAGEIYIGDKLVNFMQPKDRDIAMVFQNYSLYPHMTVYDNMAFGLKLRHYKKDEIDRKVREAAEILEIGDLLKRKPKALSGGQRQRVAIGRAIVRRPQVFLMDEPLSNLDAKLRNQMRAEIIALRKKIETTFIYVTHDQTEAMTLGDRIVVMKDGKIMQIGRPREVFDRPANLFVAGFIGTPQMNLFEAEIINKDGNIFSPFVRPG
jgi:ABC-type sugar transport systems, ATPase components